MEVSGGEHFASEAMLSLQPLSANDSAEAEVLFNGIQHGECEELA
jgi:hypothetical protein